MDGGQSCSKAKARYLISPGITGPGPYDEPMMSSVFVNPFPAP